MWSPMRPDPELWLVQACDVVTLWASLAPASIWRAPPRGGDHNDTLQSPLQVVDATSPGGDDFCGLCR